MAPLIDLSGIIVDDYKQNALKWVDLDLNKDLAEEGPDDEDLINLVNP